MLTRTLIDLIIHSLCFSALFAWGGAKCIAVGLVLVFWNYMDGRFRGRL